MNFIYLLKEQGLSEEQIKIITKEMKKHRIFVTREEKIEERFQKMKFQRDYLKSRLESAIKALSDLNEALNLKENLATINLVNKAGTIKNEKQRRGEIKYDQ